MDKPIIAIPIGDPAGIGPEIVVRAVADKQVQDTARCVVVGGRYEGLKIITKGGMVGDQNALVTCVHYLKEKLYI